MSLAAADVCVEREDILTRSGQYFDFLQPERYRVDVTDIAHGLSQCCRFVGQCAWFYSVAQHSVYVSHLVPQEHALAGLLHDAAEAFLGDVSRPLKRLLPDYRAIEKRIETVLLPALGVPYPMHPCIKRADMAILALEQRVLMPEHDDQWACLAGIEPPVFEIVEMGPREACEMFMRRYRELTA